ncbi:hypothetical protein I5M27_16980 [Adhaeribacter sp. BT258]|uniref:Porin n=1 Tax=Adhaeribacter terrigena TaxID=2793070 RepID=A0ABS1C631_9BACT|nr:hypothetical protein [Adhaeribacter terrigena]MBK0404691.1 hypothetical protein [Adhaeribacter terrigena]
MKSLLKYFVLLFILFSGVLTVRPALAQIPSNPAETDSIKTVAEHLPGMGFRLVTKKEGTLNFATYLTSRYLNQQGINSSYTDAFGRTFNLQKRNDLQFQKVMLYFKGWLFDLNFRYLLYGWTSGSNNGQNGSVIIAGNVQYKISDFLDLGVGVGGLPTSRSMIGNWPHWLRQDARPMGEEFFRGSFTTGVWAQGKITNSLFYKTMVGNNLSQMGIDAGQLDDEFDTWSTALLWKTENFGNLATYGDFEKVQTPAFMLGASYTRSDETRESQPGIEAPENTQLRLSDGTRIFFANTIADSSSVHAARYRMASFNGGLKYKGISLDGEYFLRWLTDFKADGRLPFSELFDHGFTAQAAYMLIDKTLMVYSTGSYINGEYGKPWEITAGLNWYPHKNRTLRINSEVISVERSPVGYLSYPTVVGATGTVFMMNLELFY